MEQDEHTLNSELSSITLHGGRVCNAPLGWHRVWRKPSQRQLVRIRIEKKGEKWKLGKKGGRKEREDEMNEKS